MDAKFQASFIPKQPIAPAPQDARGHLSLLYVICLVVLIVTVGLVGAELIAKQVLKRDITNLNQSLVDAKNSFELSTIDELKRTSARLEVSRQLLDKHVALSKFLEVLEQSTYSKVSFSSFSSSVSESNTLSVELAGVAASFNTLTLQSERFSSLPFLKTPAFSDFKLDKEGNILFKFNAQIDPSVVSYKRYIHEE